MGLRIYYYHFSISKFHVEEIMTVDDFQRPNFNSWRFLAGASFGGLGGYLDQQYLEPFGLILGGSLFLLQVLDYGGLAQMPWNDTVKPADDKEHLKSKDCTSFVESNVDVLIGFAAGYFIGSTNATIRSVYEEQLSNPKNPILL